MPKESFIELKQSEVLSSLKNELKRLVKSDELDRTKRKHIITVPFGAENPMEILERFYEKHEVGKHDLVQILNFSGKPLDDSKIKKKPAHKEMFEDADDDDPVLQDLGAQAPKEESSVLKDAVKPDPEIPLRPPRLKGMSWQEIRTLQEDGELTGAEERWLVKKQGVPGQFMPKLKYLQ